MLSTTPEVQGPVSRFVHLVYALGYIVTHEEIQDNLYLEVGARLVPPAMLVPSGRPRAGGGEYLQQGIQFDGSLFWRRWCGLCSTAHPNTSGGTYQNKPTIDADLSEASLEDLLILMMQVTDDRGLLINLMPKSLHIAPQNWFNANRICTRFIRRATRTTTSTFCGQLAPSPAVSSSTITSTAPQAWFVRSNIERGKGMVFLQREPISFDQDKDFDTKNAKSLGCMSGTAAASVDPRAVYGVNGPCRVIVCPYILPVIRPCNPMQSAKLYVVYQSRYL